MRIPSIFLSGFYAPALSALILVASPAASIAHDDTAPYRDGASLARTCLGETGDITKLDERLRAEGWAEIENGIHHPDIGAIGSALSPDVLWYLRQVATMYLVGDGNDPDRALSNARVAMGQDGTVPFYDPTRSKAAFYDTEVGLFIFSTRMIGNGPDALRQISCNFVGPWHSEDDRIRWQMPGKDYSNAFSHMTRIYGDEEQIGPYAGAFIQMQAKGLEALLGAEFPVLTIFSIDANAGGDQTSE